MDIHSLSCPHGSVWHWLVDSWLILAAVGSVPLYWVKSKFTRKKN